METINPPEQEGLIGTPQPVLPPPPTPLSPPPAVPQPPVKLHRSKAPWVLVGLLVVAIVVIAGGALAYSNGWNPLAPQLTPQEVVLKMLESVVQIKSAHYDVSLGFKSEPREVGAEPISVAVPEIGQQQEALKRDQTRLSNIPTLVYALQNHQQRYRSYPLDLVSAVSGDTSSLLDPGTHQQYGYRQEQGGKDFTLAVQLETDAAAQAYQTAAKAASASRLIEMHGSSQPVYASVSGGATGIYPLGFNPDTMYEYLPTEIEASFSLSGQSQSQVSKTNDASYTMNGKVALGSVSFSGAADIMKKADTYFLRLSEAPSFGYFDLAAVKNKWIKITPETAKGTALEYLFYRPKEEANVDQRSAQLIQEYEILFRLFKEENLIKVASVLPNEKIGSETLYHYEIQLDYTKFGDFYKRLTDESKNTLGDKALFQYDPQVAAYLTDPAFQKFAAASEKNTSLQVWIDRKTFQPRKISYTNRFVPPATAAKLKDKQYRFLFSMGLSNVNQDVVVEVPGDTISIQDAETLISGTSTPAGPLTGAYANAKDAKIKSDIGQLRVLAEILYDNTNSTYSNVGPCFMSGTEAMCAKDKSLANSVTDLRKDITEANAAADLHAYSSKQAFCVEAQLTSAGTFACMDSNGIYKQPTAPVCTQASLHC